MKKMINQTHVSGVLYEHSLELRVSGPNSKTPGVEYIRGEVKIATDNAMLNIVPVSFTYVTATTAKGTNNATYEVLKNIVDGNYGSVMSVGADKAVKLRIDSAIGLNEFYSDRNGTDELVSVKCNQGGFVHRADVLEEDENTRNTFKVDMLITGVTHVDADEERNTTERVLVKGAIFDFRNSLLPVEFTATNPSAMAYFESLDASSKNPTFTCVWGRQISTTVVRQIRTESAFGEDEIREVRNSRKDYLITGANRETYVWDDETTLTAAEVNEAIQRREIDLAAMKKRNDDYKASRSATPAAAAITSNGGFNF